MATLETLQLVNGVWTTVTVDVHHIMSNLRNRREERPKFEASKLLSSEENPVYGILSQTAFRSPLIKWIIPARLRDKLKNDVVFVGEDFVHIKETEFDGHLRHIATKADFPAKIRAARVLGEPRQPPANPPIKSENPESSMDIDTESPANITRQLLVLTLANNEMMFLFAASSVDGSVQFKSRSLPLPAPPALLSQPGVHLAVDPQSRALAVAAWRDTIMLYSTDFTLHEGDDVPIPINDERAIRIDGVILAMDFLYPAANDPDHVIFVVVSTSHRKTRISCYEWDRSAGLGSLAARVDGQLLSKAESKPLLLIPLQWSSDFMLVSKGEIYIYRNILSGTAQAASLSQQDLFSEPSQLQPTNRPALCVNWARVPRLTSALYENYYLVREDGVLYYLDVSQNGSSRATKCGQFGCCIDTAFAFLHVSLTHPDFLIAAGSSSPGELLSIGDQKYEDEGLRPLGRQRTETLSPKYIESVPNWSPCVDVVVPPGNAHGGRVYTLGGKSPFGAISELKWAIEAKLVYIFDLDGIEGLTGIWAFDDPTGNGTHFLFSFPVQSFHWHLADSPDDESESGMGNPEIDTDNETIASVAFSVEKILQISRHKIVLLALPSLSSLSTFEFPSDTVLIAAGTHVPQSAIALENEGTGSKVTTPLAMVAVRTSSELELIVFRYDNGTNSMVKASSVSPPSEPTCLDLFEHDGVLLAAVGTADGQLLVYRVDEEYNLHCLAQHRLGTSSTLAQEVSSSAPTNQRVCDAIIPVKQESPRRTTLVCGLRDGLLSIIDVTSDEFNMEEHSISSVRLREAFESTKRIGKTPVRVIRKDDSVLAICGSGIYHIDFKSTARGDFSIHKVCFTDRNQPDYEQSTISAVLSKPRSLRLTKGINDPLICVSKGKLLVAQLKECPEVVTRRLAVLGTPYRAIYSGALNNMIVAAAQARTHNPDAKRNPSAASHDDTSSIIQIVDLEEHEEIEEEVPAASTEQLTLAAVNGLHSLKRVRATHELFPYERVNSITNWQLKIDTGTTHHLLVAGIEVMENRFRSRSGRLLFLQPQENSKTGLTIKVAKSKDCPSPVYSVAEIDTNRLVYCTGTTLTIEEFTLPDKKLITLASYDLFSPATQISVSGGKVFATTAEHSFFAFEFITQPRFGDDPEPPSYDFELRYTDGQKRNSINHLSLPIRIENNSLVTQRFLTLISDKSCTLAGLWQPKPALRRNAAPTLFQATLPRSIIRLRKGSIKPSWSRNLHSPSNEGIITDDIIGLSSDGTLFGFTIVNARVWSTLKFLELLIRVHGLQTNLSTSTSRQSHHDLLRTTKLKMLAIEREGHASEEAIRRLLGPPDYHINGDLFLPLLNLPDVDAFAAEVKRMLQEAGGEIVEKWNSLLLATNEPTMTGTEKRASTQEDRGDAPSRNTFPSGGHGNGEHAFGASSDAIEKAHLAAIKLVRDLIQPVL